MGCETSGEPIYFEVTLREEGVDGLSAGSHHYYSNDDVEKNKVFNYFILGNKNAFDLVIIIKKFICYINIIWQVYLRFIGLFTDDDDVDKTKYYNISYNKYNKNKLIAIVTAFLRNFVFINTIKISINKIMKEKNLVTVIRHVLHERLTFIRKC